MTAQADQGMGHALATVTQQINIVYVHVDVKDHMKTWVHIKP